MFLKCYFHLIYYRIKHVLMFVTHTPMFFLQLWHVLTETVRCSVTGSWVGVGLVVVGVIPTAVVLASRRPVVAVGARARPVHGVPQPLKPRLGKEQEVPRPVGRVVVAVRRRLAALMGGLLGVILVVVGPRRSAAGRRRGAVAGRFRLRRRRIWRRRRLLIVSCALCRLEPTLTSVTGRLCRLLVR